MKNINTHKYKMRSNFKLWYETEWATGSTSLVCMSVWVSERPEVWRPQGVACWECFGDIIALNNGSVFADNNQTRHIKKSWREKKLGLIRLKKPIAEKINRICKGGRETIELVWKNRYPKKESMPRHNKCSNSFTVKHEI